MQLAYPCNWHAGFDNREVCFLSWLWGRQVLFQCIVAIHLILRWSVLLPANRCSPFEYPHGDRTCLPFDCCMCSMWWLDERCISLTVVVHQHVLPRQLHHLVFWRYLYSSYSREGLRICYTVWKLLPSHAVWIISRCCGKRQAVLHMSADAMLGPMMLTLEFWQTVSSVSMGAWWWGP